MVWFRKSKANGPDYSGVTSREKATRLVEKGELVPLFLLPEIFGGTPVPENVVFVPAFAAELKCEADENVIRPLAQDGKITRYRAEPRYAGKSIVPVMLTVHAFEPGNFTTEICIWGIGLRES